MRRSVGNQVTRGAKRSAEEGVVKAKPERTWNPRSTSSEIMNATLRLENPTVQNPLGMEVVETTAAASDHT